MAQKRKFSGHSIGIYSWQEWQICALLQHSIRRSNLFKHPSIRKCKLDFGNLVRVETLPHPPPQVNKTHLFCHPTTNLKALLSKQSTCHICKSWNDLQGFALCTIWQIPLLGKTMYLVRVVLGATFFFNVPLFFGSHKLSISNYFGKFRLIDYQFHYQSNTLNYKISEL